MTGTFSINGCGLQVELNRANNYPDGENHACPAIVYNEFGEQASYWMVLYYGYIGNTQTTWQQDEWLFSIYFQVNEFLCNFENGV